MESPDAVSQYHQFLGLFISQFADSEFNIRRLLRIQSGLDDAMFDVLIGLPRSSDATNKLRQLALKRPDSDNEAKEAVSDALAQLGNVTQLRDWVVHYGGHPTDTGDILIRLKPNQISRTTGKHYHLFKPQELWNAIADIQRINFVLIFRLDPTLSSEELGIIHNFADRKPWKYKPPPLGGGRQ